MVRTVYPADIYYWIMDHWYIVLIAIAVIEGILVWCRIHTSKNK